MAASVYKGLTVQIGADTTRLDKALREATKSAEGTYKQLRQVNSALKTDPSNIELLTQKQSLLNKQIEASTNKLDVLKDAMAQLDEQGIDHDSAEWTQLIADISKTETNLKKYKEELAETAKQQSLIESGAKAAGEKIKDIGEKAEKAGDNLKSAGDKIQGFSDGVGRVGGALTAGVTAPIMAAGTAAVMAAVDIDSGLTSVKKTVDGTAEQYQQLKDAAIEFSKTNAVSAAQMLELDALGAQLSFGIEELELFGKVASGLDIATDMDAETAATEMAQFANITQMAHGDIERYGSAIVNIGNNMATTESKVSSMSQRIAAAGTQTKMSQADILGWAGAMSSLGIEAEAGGTAFSTTISTIDAAVAKGGDGLAKFAKIAGKSSDEFAKSWQENSSAAFQELLSGVDGAENMTIALEEMGVTGIRQSDVLKRLAGNTNLVSDALDFANEGWKQNTALQTEVDNRNNSLAAKFEILKNRVTAVAEQVGSPLADALLDAVDAAEPLIEIVQDGAEAFSNMSKEEQQNTLKNIAMVASLGPMLTIVSKVGGAFGGVVKGIGGATSAVGAFTKGIGALKSGTTSATSVIGGLKGGLIGVGVAAAAAVAAFAISKWQQWSAEMERNEKASKSLSDMQNEAAESVKKLSDEVDKSKDSQKNLRDELDKTKDKLDEIKDKSAEAADSFTEDWGNIDYDEARIQNLKDGIDDLRDRALTSAEQQTLRTMVDQFNEITGESIEILDIENGKLSATREELTKLGDQYIATAKKQSLAKLMQESQDTIAALELEAPDIYNNYWSAFDRYQAAVSDPMSILTGEIREASKAWSDAQKDVNDYVTNYEVAQGRVEDCANQMAEIDKVTAQSAENIHKISEAIKGYGDGAAKAMSDTKVDVLKLNGALGDAGVRSGTMEALTSEAFEKIVRESGGDVAKIVDNIKQMQDAYDESVAKVDRVKDAIGKFGDATKDKLGAARIDIDQLAQKFVEAGGNAETMGLMSNTQFESMALQCSGNVDQMVGKLLEFQGSQEDSISKTIGMKDALAEYADSTKQKLQESGVDIDQLAGKLVGAGVTTEDLRNISDTQLRAMADNCGGNVDRMVDDIKRFNDRKIDEKKVSINSTDLKKTDDMLGDILNSLFTIAGRTWNAAVNFFTGGNAEGGIAIPRHADGGILAHPTLTRAGWVGEAGAEAIIPLTNRKYVGTFARTVAAEMGASSNTSTTTIQFIFDNATLNDDAAMREAGLTLFEEVQRRAAMNLG